MVPIGHGHIACLLYHSRLDLETKSGAGRLFARNFCPDLSVSLEMGIRLTERSDPEEPVWTRFPSISNQERDVLENGSRNRRFRAFWEWTSQRLAL